MSYTNSPMVSTYSTSRVPLAYGIQARAGLVSLTTDPGMVNVLPFKEKDEGGHDVVWGETRYAIRGITINNTPGNITRGMFVWEKTPGTLYYFAVVNQSVYTSTNGAVWNVVNTLTTAATTPVRFTEYIDASNTKKLIMVDGVEGYIFTSSAAGTKITDANFPSPHVPFPIYLDGYLFLAKANTGDIYNSDLNSPSTWTAGNFFSAQGYPDDIKALIRINNYIAAIGSSSTEYFYDAGNSPGSPLARLDGATLPFGTNHPNTIAANKDTIIFLSNNGDGESTVRMIEGLKYKEVSARFVVTLMSNIIAVASNMRGYLFRQQGELFYGLCFDGTNTSATAAPQQGLTLVYSFNTELWSEFQYSSPQTYMFPVYFTSPATSGSSFTYVAGSFGGLAFFGFWSQSNAKYNDSLDGISEAAISETVRTPSFDFGTMNYKTMSRVGLGFTALFENGVSQVRCQYSDGDWTGLNTAEVLFGNNTGAGVDDNGRSSFPFITRLGIFRVRAFILSSTSGIPKQWKFLEFDINKLQQ